MSTSLVKQILLSTRTTYNHADLVALLTAQAGEYAEMLADSGRVFGPLLDRALVEYADHFPGSRP